MDLNELDSIKVERASLRLQLETCLITLDETLRLWRRVSRATESLIDETLEILAVVIPVEDRLRYAELLDAYQEMACGVKALIADLDLDAEKVKN